MNAFLFLVLLAEVLLLFRIEKKMWRTLYTPLNFLMLPYAVVLGITLILSGRLGLAEFYYPSLIPWIIGLPLFAVPGWLFFLYERRSTHRNKPEINQERFLFLNKNSYSRNNKAYLFKIVLAVLIIIMLGFRLVVLLMQGKGMVGNEAFGNLFVGKGWAGHLLLLGTALMIMLLFENRKWPTWMVSAFLLFFLFVYQVKSWIILPLLTVFFALLITERLKPRFRHLLWVGGAAVFVFFASYLMIYLTGNRLFSEAVTLRAQLQSISGLFVHYITSGTLGLSIDMQQGVLEEPNLQYIFAPFYNCWYFLTGKPLISGVNPEYMYSGINLTNVRGFFGTVFVFTRPAGFAFCILLFGFLSQTVFFFFRRYGTVCPTLLYAWLCAVLFMGWFEFLFCLLTVFEIPFWILTISAFQRFLITTDKTTT
ncbi:MAG: DUF6337 family protein [Bacteroides sp.]|nr:DUF6337 family protein [Ruminococcus flavefaciens]MCM1554262.1 DUF6337 family protein [Bacteroides sp.]